jgi:hypothetical protein
MLRRLFATFSGLIARVTGRTRTPRRTTTTSPVRHY